MHVNKELLQSILLSERSWKRHCRIDHARQRINAATSKEERELWTAVLHANGGKLEQASNVVPFPKRKKTRRPKQEVLKAA